MMKPCNSTIKRALVGILLLSGAALFPLDLPVRQIEDDSAIRAAVKDAWLLETPARVIRNRPFSRSLPGGSPVQVRAETRGNEITVILAREWNGTFPGWAQGSWVLTRFMDGAYERIRIFLHSDPYTYIQFRPMENAGDGGDPANGKSLLDVVLYEAYVVRGLPLGFPMESLLTMPLNDIFDALGDKFPRRYFDPDPDMYRDTRELAGKVRAGLAKLKFADDGAIDENGRYVFINTLSPQNTSGGPEDGTARGGLNCSGFTKWFVDGLLYPVSGRLLPITPLKEASSKKSSSLAENYAAIRDPAFGLDWTRNLAMEAARVLRSPGTSALEDVEVRGGTFAAVIDRRGGRAAVKSYPAFLPGAGFSMEGLRPLLYTLAVNEPGYVYLASVNTETGPVPRMRQHYHEAVFFPYFNEYGVFQTAVFESAVETSLNAFIARYPGQMVNLVRVPVEARFTAQP
ncbi:MAG: hypothetical protein LBI67_09705 [Treponema sp.]|jgi:hypothetical protein|nr:hypothetical protein [Treponema sp.]